MIRSIDIKNYRCFEQLHIENCRRVNVIVGDNAVGKTSLLESIFLALGVTPELGLRYRQQRGLDGVFSGPVAKIEEAIWKDLFYQGDWTRPIQVNVIGDGPATRSVSVTRGLAQLTIPLGGESTAEESRIAPITFDWKDAEGKHHVRSPRVSPRGLDIEGPDEDQPDFFYFPANFMAGSVEAAGKFSELRRAGRAKEFMRLLTQEYRWIENLDIEVIAGAPIIYAKTRNANNMLPLANISSGINRIVGIMLSIASHDGAIILADEMEDGIFYSHHEALWRAMLSLVRNYGGQLFVTTHSYEWIRALMGAAKDKIEDIALWRLERSDTAQPELFRFEGDVVRDAVKRGTEARGR